MVGIPLPADRPFFEQWSRRTSTHSLNSARVLLDRLSPASLPTLRVLGSKGKGSAAAGATAALHSAGLKVLTVSSPAHVTNRERIRLDGRALSEREYEEASGILADHLPHLPTDSYLCPSGAYTVMGAWWAARCGADVLVLEEGMGGASDEVSLFPASHEVVTPIFAEHVGELADTVEGVVDDLLGIRPTVAYGSGNQELPYARSILESWDLRQVEWSPLPHPNRLVGQALGLGWHVGADMARCLGHAIGGVPTINLPGRTSTHVWNGGRWVVDGAVSPDGVRALLESDPPARVIACWPSSKDWQACRQVVPHAELVATGSHLAFPDGLPRLSDLDLSGDVTAVGTQSFVGEVLTLIGADTESWF